MVDPKVPGPCGISQVQRMLDFMFGDEISAEQRQLIALAAQVEDESRGLEAGISANDLDLHKNHTNDEQDQRGFLRSFSGSVAL